MAAGLGLILFPIATAFAFTRHALSFVLDKAPFYIVVFSLSFGTHSASLFGGGFIGGVVGTLLAASLLTGLFVGLGPMVLALSALRALLMAPLQGLRKGWREGFGPMFSSVFKLVFTISLGELIIGSGLFSTMTPATAITTTTTMLQQLNAGGGIMDAVVIQARQPITAATFDGMQLSADETCAWRVMPLSEQEITFLEGQQESDSELRAALQAYKNLVRLDTDTCAISLERPGPEDLVLLFKQYKSLTDEWLPVPNVAHVFTKDALKTCFTSSEYARHPISREVIIEPPAYVVNGQSYPARYRFHHYYNHDGQALSQERTENIKFLREKAENLQLLHAARSVIDYPDEDGGYRP